MLYGVNNAPNICEKHFFDQKGVKKLYISDLSCTFVGF